MAGTLSSSSIADGRWISPTSVDNDHQPSYIADKGACISPTFTRLSPTPLSSITDKR